MIIKSNLGQDQDKKLQHWFNCCQTIEFRFQFIEDYDKETGKHAGLKIYELVKYYILNNEINLEYKEVENFTKPDKDQQKYMKQLKLL